MIRLLWAGSVHTRYFLRRYMPTNTLLDAIRTPRGLKWGVPAMLLTVPYFLIAAVLVQIIHDGGSSLASHARSTEHLERTKDAIGWTIKLDPAGASPCQQAQDHTPKPDDREVCAAYGLRSV